MATQAHDNDPALARRKLIELLEDEDGWRFKEQALNEGRIALKGAHRENAVRVRDDRLLHRSAARGFPHLAYTAGRTARIERNRVGDEQS